MKRVLLALLLLGSHVSACADFSAGHLLPPAMSSCRNAPWDERREAGASLKELEKASDQIEQEALDCESLLTVEDRTIWVYREPDGPVLGEFEVEPGRWFPMTLGGCGAGWCEIVLDDGRRAWVVDGWPDLYLRLD